MHLAQQVDGKFDIFWNNGLSLLAFSNTWTNAYIALLPWVPRDKTKDKHPGRLDTANEGIRSFIPPFPSLSPLSCGLSVASVIATLQGHPALTPNQNHKEPESFSCFSWIFYFKDGCRQLAQACSACLCPEIPRRNDLEFHDQPWSLFSFWAPRRIAFCEVFHPKPTTLLKNTIILSAGGLSRRLF